MYSVGFQFLSLEVDTLINYLLLSLSSAAGSVMLPHSSTSPISWEGTTSSALLSTWGKQTILSHLSHNILMYFPTCILANDVPPSLSLSLL